MTISFNVAGIPEPQPRPRATIRGGHVHIYNPDEAKSWKDLVKLKAMMEISPFKPRNGDSIKCGVFLEITFRLPVAKSLPKKTVNTLHVKRPDLDNLVKAVMDALTDIGAWRDDSQVFRVHAEKFYAYEPGNEGATIKIHYEKESGGLLV